MVHGSVCAEDREACVFDPAGWNGFEMKDSFDQFWDWANNDPTDPNAEPLTIPSDLHFVMTELLSPEDRRDRAKVNKAVEEYRAAKQQKAAPLPKE
jgi:hypothetical protein